MVYFKITYSNGYCGCEDEYYVKLNDEDANKIDQIFEDCFDYYIFNDDERYMDDINLEDYENEDDYETALYTRADAYNELIQYNSTYEEITKEEYDEAIEGGCANTYLVKESRQALFDRHDCARPLRNHAEILL